MSDYAYVAYLTHWREHWQPDTRAWFEYHCNESHDSEHAEWWYRSHQQVTVLGEAPHDGWPGSSFEERVEAGQPKLYNIRWDDGFEGAAFEDELLNSTSGYERPDPPDSSEVTEP